MWRRAEGDVAREAAGVGAGKATVKTYFTLV